MRRNSGQKVIRTVSGDKSTLTARIIGGNTLTSGSPGIKYAASITNVNAAITPWTDPALQDGLGYGYLFRNGRAVLEDDGVGGLRQVRVAIANYGSVSVSKQALVLDEWIYLGARIVLPGTAAQVAYGIGPA